MVSQLSSNTQMQIVPYQGDFFRREIKNYQAKIMTIMLSRQLFFYPVQQQCLKNQVKILVSHDLFAYKVFCSIFERVTEIYETPDKLNLIFILFQKFAENPSDGICGRAFWSSYHETIPDEFEEKKVFLEVSRCGITAEALMTSIFGIKKTRNLQRLEIDSTRKKGSHQVWRIIENNFKYLLRSKDSDFFAYSFVLNNADSFPGHAFLVVQYLAESGEIKYHIFQSFIGEFCLKSFLNNGAKILSNEEFNIFIKNLERLILSDTWTAPLEKIYQSQFNVKKGFAIGKKNPCSGVKLFIELGCARISNIFEQIKKFELFKNLGEFPSIEAICMCCNESERKRECLTDEELRILDKKLFNLYERDRFNKTGCEHIQIDLDSLDLDLSEEGQVDVPERDKYGNLVMDGRDPVWIERIITLRTVTEAVIGELNKLVSENMAMNIADKSDIVLLNTNREPFSSYNRLGLLNDQFSISKEDEEKLWLRRIINALCKNGCVKKIDRVNGHGIFVQI